MNEPKYVQEGRGSTFAELGILAAEEVLAKAEVVRPSGEIIHAEVARCGAQGLLEQSTASLSLGQLDVGGVDDALLIRKPVFWSRSYGIISDGGAPLSVLRQYIEQQQGAERKTSRASPSAPLHPPPSLRLWLEHCGANLGSGTRPQ